MSFTSKSTGGSYKHKLTVSEMPSHNHPGSKTNDYKWDTKSGSNTYFTCNSPQTHAAAMGVQVASQGSNGLHNNVQPYYVVYMWKRTA